MPDVDKAWDGVVDKSGEWWGGVGGGCVVES